jgi:ribosomal protein L24
MTVAALQAPHHIAYSMCYFFISRNSHLSLFSHYLKEMKQDASFAQYADAPDLEAYEAKPVESFGLSLLQSMGFTPQRGIGHNKKNALSDVLVLKPRPRGLGLGAEQEDEQKKPRFEVGACVVITKGPHDGLAGVVAEVREEELTVELAKSGSLVRVAAAEVRELTREQQKEQAVEGEEGERKKKRLKWVVPNIRVKIVDKKSKYYLKKAVVSEVLNEREFECFLSEGGRREFVKTLREKDLQTVVPKPGGEVVVVRGSHTGDRGKVLKNDRQSEKVVVQTEAELELITVAQDDLTEYVDL